MALAALAAVVGCGRDSETQRLLGRHLLESGLAIELVAAEPLVFDPVDLEFDEHGHAFVLEMPGFPLVSEDQPRPGRVVELVDEDGDGRFDRRLPFADGFRYADSILPYRGGLLVADAPDLVYLKDTDGDGQADLRQVVISGFGLGPSESLFNGLRHGLDNWIYAANGSSGGDVFLVFPAGHPESPVSIRGQDVRFRFRSDPADPQRLGDGELERAGRTGGGFGLDFDDWGRRFVTHEQRHIQAAIIPERYLARGHTWPSTTVEISDHGQDEGARVFPISAPEARPNHPEQAGHFTAGCGLTRWAGGILPPGLEGSFFVAEAVHHLVHRDVVEADGAGFRARRATARSESLAVADPWSRPVNFALGPNGALYLLDMQRAVIEHPEWIPDELERDLDLRAGEDRGRIYRLTAAGATGAEAEPLATSREGWLGELGHKNAWRRYTAQRLLVEAGDTETPARLRALLAASPSPLAPLAQLHILWTLDGLGALEPLDLITAFSAIEPGLRENALILAEHFLVRDRDLRQLTITLARDPDPRVRLQALLSLSTLPLQTADPNDPDGPDDADVLSAIAAQALLDDRDDPWIRIAALNLASADPFAVLERCCTGDAGNGAPSPEAVAGLARLIGEGVRDGGVADTVAAVAARLFNGSGDGALALAVLDGLAGGLETRPAASSDRRSASAAVVAALGPLLDHPEPAIAAAAARIARAEGIPPTAAQLQRARSAALSASDSTLPTKAVSMPWPCSRRSTSPSERRCWSSSSMSASRSRCNAPRSPSSLRPTIPQSPGSWWRSGHTWDRRCASALATCSSIGHDTSPCSSTLSSRESCRSASSTSTSSVAGPCSALAIQRSASALHGCSPTSR